MKKFKKKKLGVSLVLILAIFTFLNLFVLSSVDAADEEDKVDDKKCEEQTNKKPYSFTVNRTTSGLNVSVNRGKFKITSMKVKGSQVDDLITNYSDDMVLSSGGSLSLNLNISKYSSDDVEIVFTLSEDDADCKVGDYVHTVTAVLTDISESSMTKPDVMDQDNINYNGICRAIREGAKGVGISNSTMALYENSSEALAYYKSIVGYCWDEKVSYNLNKSSLKTDIVNAIEAYSNEKALYNNEKPTNSDPSFEQAFQASFERAKKAGGDHFFETLNSNTLKTKTLKCDTNYAKSATSEYDYSANIQSYYAKETTPINATYKYTKTGSSMGANRTVGGVTTTETKQVCDRVCEEAVDVEYGPPVASKGGLCFEYRVKITSRVKCDTKINESGKPRQATYCSPAPYCINNGGAATMHQGGPNEDFDKCVLNCDGGKYSQACSVKCYNEVYNKGNNKLNYNSILYNGAVKKTALENRNFCASSACVIFDPNGYYLVSSGGEISFTSGYARWYKNNEYYRTIADHGAYGYIQGQGIKRANYGGSYCNDACSYAACGDGHYNKQDADADNSANNKIYASAIKQCRAQASCTTKTAEFTMSTDYIDGEGKNVTITYPLSTGKSTLASKSKDGMPKESTLNECKSGDSNSNSSACDNVILNYDGCYEEKAAGNIYETEITYPGTWIKNKTQEISYQAKPDKGWYKENHKFCLPLDAQDVNTKWWLWYMNKQALDGQYYFEEEYKDICNIIDNKISKDSEAPKDGIVYNIHSKLKNFGYFGWNFNVDCFYAIYNDISVINEDSEELKEKCNTNPLNYEVRSVDLTDMFPSEDGSEIPSASSTGRLPGYNWTNSATIDSLKAKTTSGTTNYYVNPELLIAKIQNRGDDIFEGDEYVDYEFHLDPSIMNKIRNYNRKYSYTDFNGEFYDSKERINKYGFIAYKSNLFNFSGKASVNDGYNMLGNVGGKYVKAVGNIGCNNDGSGSACETTANID